MQRLLNAGNLRVRVELYNDDSLLVLHLLVRQLSVSSRRSS